MISLFFALNKAFKYKNWYTIEVSYFLSPLSRSQKNEYKAIYIYIYKMQAH